MSVSNLIEKFPALNNPELLKEISQLSPSVHLKTGDTVCEFGQDCSHLALVLKGSARIYQLAESGREITLYRVTEGECCILTASCLLSNRTFPAIAVCEEALDVLVIPAAQVRDWMLRFEDWNSFVWTLISDRLSSVLCLLEEVTFRRLDQRLFQYLLKQEKLQGATLIITHQTIAADLGTSREVVSRILKDLQHKKLLSQRRGQIEIHDRDALTQALKLCD